MFAIIKTGGKQYKVKEGDVLEVEKLEARADKSVDFSEVLLIADDKDVKIGTPFITGAKVTAKVLEQKKGKKVIAFKYKAKKRYRRKHGHRQLLTKVQIENIETGDKRQVTSDKDKTEYGVSGKKKKEVKKAPIKKSKTIKK